MIILIIDKLLLLLFIICSIDKSLLRSQVPPPLLQCQSGTEHTDNESIAVWVNHGQQSPTPTVDGSLCECGSYSVSKR